MSPKTKALLIAGTRPNFVKIAALAKAAQTEAWLDLKIVHTGQHYDAVMSDLFFQQLGIPAPDINLGAGSGSPAEQLARIMVRFEPILIRERPDMIIVVGDVTSTLATAIIASRYQVPIVHVEAGLRSFDSSMPEEINRILTDRISTMFFVTEQSGCDNLLTEGTAAERIRLVGNVMIDSLFASLTQASQSTVHSDLGIEGLEYGLATVHRPGNIDDDHQARRIIDCLLTASRFMPIVVPLHPRSKKSLSEKGLLVHLEHTHNVFLCDPVGYFDFIALERKAQVVLTDSGGVQEETTALGIPCLTLRENTERPCTIEVGTNTLVGVEADRVGNWLEAICAGTYKRGELPYLWDGKSAGRILSSLKSYTN